MKSPMEFETARLQLRQWCGADRAAFAALNADPEVMAHFPAPLTREQSDATVDHCERFLAEHGWGPWAAEVKTTGALIGLVGLNIPRSDLPISPCVEVLWRLARAHWHHGYATEAARGALHIGFEVAQMREIGIHGACKPSISIGDGAARDEPGRRDVRTSRRSGRPQTTISLQLPADARQLARLPSGPAAGYCAP